MGDELERPEGPVTVMFTDIEGSTALRTSLGDAAADVVFGQHAKIVCEQIRAHRGHDAGTIPDVTFADRGMCELKGFPDPCRLWSLSWRIPRPDQIREVFVARDRELGELRSRLADALAGRGGLVLVGGEPGVGKTALVKQVIKEAEQQGVVLRSTWHHVRPDDLVWLLELTAPRVRPVWSWWTASSSAPPSGRSPAGSSAWSSSRSAASPTTSGRPSTSLRRGPAHLQGSMPPCTAAEPADRRR